MQVARSQAARHSTSSYEKSPSLGRLKVSDAELLSKVCHDVFGAVDDAGQSATNLQDVLSDRPPIKQRIERNRAFHFSGCDLEHFRRGMHRLRAHEALMLLKQMHNRQKRRPLLLVPRDDRFALRSQPLEQRRKVFFSVGHLRDVTHYGGSGDARFFASCEKAARLVVALALQAALLPSHARHHRNARRRSR